MVRLKKSYYLKSFQELAGAQRLWPWAIKRVIYGQQHLSNTDRFKVIVFLRGNGVPREMINHFFEDCFSFDSAAWRQINWVQDKFPHTWTYWDVTLGRSVR